MDIQAGISMQAHAATEAKTDAKIMDIHVDMREFLEIHTCMDIL